MLKILNNLSQFFGDCYRRISVREYAKLQRISPPTASKLLKAYCKEGFLLQEENRRHLFFVLNRENRDVQDLAHMYWRHQLAGLCAELKRQWADPTVVLFGSLAKAEAKRDSDVDLAIFVAEPKNISFASWKRELKREIAPQYFKTLGEVKNVHLRNNILNGYVLLGRLRWE